MGNANHLIGCYARQQIDRAAANLQAKRDGTDHLAIKAALEELDKTATEFVARRMDTSIRDAMAGHSVNEFLPEETDS